MPACHLITSRFPENLRDALIIACIHSRHNWIETRPDGNSTNNMTRILLDVPRVLWIFSEERRSYLIGGDVNNTRWRTRNSKGVAIYRRVILQIFWTRRYGVLVASLGGTGEGRNGRIPFRIGWWDASMRQLCHSGDWFFFFYEFCKQEEYIYRAYNNFRYFC